MNEDRSHAVMLLAAGCWLLLLLLVQLAQAGPGSGISSSSVHYA